MPCVGIIMSYELSSSLGPILLRLTKVVGASPKLRALRSRRKQLVLMAKIAAFGS
jgi:hypothetical protein